MSAAAVSSHPTAARPAIPSAPICAECTEHVKYLAGRANRCDHCDDSHAQFSPRPPLGRSDVELELLASLTAEEQSAIRNLLCAPTITLSDERSTVLELTAAEQAIDLLWAALRARRVYLIAVGAGR